MTDSPKPMLGSPEGPVPTTRNAASTAPDPAPGAPAAADRPVRWRGRLARIAGAVGVLALTGAAVGAGLVVPVPADVATPPFAVDVPANEETLVCAGALTQPEGDGVADSSFDPTPVETRTEVRAVSSADPDAPSAGDAVAAPAGTLSSLGADDVLAELGPAGAAGAQLRAGGLPGPTVLTAQPAGNLPPRAAAASASLTSAGDLRGLAAASCPAPAAEQWLVGGSTEIGSSATLVVANPGATPAEISVEVYGPSGAVDLAGSTGFLVAPGVERAVLLEGVAAEQRRIAVRVSAAGGLVTARIQDSRLDGFTPAGVDLVSAGAQPALRQSVGGLVVPDSAIDAADAAVLRLLAPGESDTTARISLLGPTGIVLLPGAESVDLVAGEVTDLPLGGLAPGAYTAVIVADQPLVAGAMITRQGLPGELDDLPTLERAWSASAVPGIDGAVALPAGVTGTAVLTAIGAEADGSGDGSATGTLRAIGADGEILAEVEVTVRAGTTESVSFESLAPGASVVGVDLVLPRAGPEGTEGTEGTDGVDDPTSTAGDPVLAWSALATVTAPDGEFVSVLQAVPAATAPPSVTLRQARTLGLG